MKTDVNSLPSWVQSFYYIDQKLIIIKLVYDNMFCFEEKKS